MPWKPENVVPQTRTAPLRRVNVISALGILFTTLGRRQPGSGLLRDGDRAGMVFDQPLSTVPPLDALFLPITFFATICAADWWFQRGVVLLVLKQAHNLFNAFIALPTALATWRPQARDGMEDHRHRDKRRSAGLLANSRSCSLSDCIHPLWHPLHNDQWLVSDRAPLFAVALLFWTAWQLTMLNAGRSGEL